MLYKYIPVLKSKRGEFKALSVLEMVDKDKMIPLIELLDGSSAVTYDQMSTIWNFHGNQLIIDGSLFLVKNNLQDYIKLITELLNAGIGVIPVLELDTPNSIKNSVITFIRTHNLKYCIRIKQKHFDPHNILQNIKTLILEVGSNSEQVIVILDCENITASNIDSYKRIVNDCLTAIGGLSQFYIVAVASGSFPVDLSKISADTKKFLPRFEWQMWQNIGLKFNSNNLVYSDYGIKHPLIDPSTTPFEGTCSIKYTTEDNYVIFRGIRGSDHPLGGGQYHEKCRLLIE